MYNRIFELPQFFDLMRDAAKKWNIRERIWTFGGFIYALLIYQVNKHRHQMCSCLEIKYDATLKIPYLNKDDFLRYSLKSIINKYLFKINFNLFPIASDF